MSAVGFRDSLRSVVPKWLTDRGTFKTGFQFLYVVTGQFDRAMQALLEGTRAQLAGSDTRVDHLALVGQSRMRLQGETQTPEQFLGTLQTWLADLRDLGGDVGLAKELHRWLAGNPQVRVISRRGLYTTVSATGVVTQVQSTWNWDSVSNPERNTGVPNSAGWFDYWIVVYPLTASTYPTTGYVATTGHWGDGQNHQPGTTQGIGLSITPQEVDTIRGLITTWRGAHVTPRCLIWSYDNAAFDPANVGRSGNPNGRWGKWFDPTTHLASRNRTHRYSSLGPERP